MRSARLIEIDGLSLADAAVAWVRAGFHPILIHGVRDGRCTCSRAQCTSAGKHPVGYTWERAELDLDGLVRELQRSRVPRNLGLRMGVQSSGKRLLAVDDDGGLAAFETEHGQLPDTLTLRSGGGGKHRLYHVPPGVPLRNKVKVQGFDLDIRCDHGQIVVSPSLHKSGGRYGVAAERPIADLPDWAVEMLRDKPIASSASADLGGWSISGELRNQSERILAYCRSKAEQDRSVEGTGTGAGSAALARWCGTIFWKFGLSELEGWPLLCEMNSIGASPPWSERELRHAMANGMKPHPSRPERRGHLLSDWAREDELNAERKGAERERGDSMRSSATDFDFGPIEYLDLDEPGGAEEQSRILQMAPLLAHAEPVNVSLVVEPARADEQLARAPLARVPEPEAGATTETEEAPPPPIPRRPPNRVLDASTVMAVTDCLLMDIDAKYPGFVYDGGRFWLYSGGIFRALPDWWIYSAVDGYDGCRSAERGDGFRSNVTNQRSVRALLATKLECRQNMPEGVSFFDDSPALAVFSNGAIVIGADGKPGWAREHSPEHRARFRYEFEYKSGLEPKHLLAVMRDWFAGCTEEEIGLRILALRQYAGHALLNSLWRRKLSVALMLLGGGHDGKSTFLNLVRRLMPPGSTCAMDPEALASKSVCVDLTRAALHGKLANIVGDISDSQWHNTSFLKSVIDHEPVSARRGRGGDPFTFKPQLASLFAGNKLPKVGDKSWGFFRRWLLIHFPNSIPIEKRDGQLENKLLALEAREIACWFMDAALQMLEAKGSGWFAEPACHAELRAQWAAGDDSVSSFVSEYTVDAGDDKASWTPLAKLYDAYERWCLWAYGEFRAKRETESRRGFALKLKTVRNAQKATRGKSNEVVINRVVKTEAGGSK